MCALAVLDQHLSENPFGPRPVPAKAINERPAIRDLRLRRRVSAPRARGTS